jgi:hypothetical protein
MQQHPQVQCNDLTADDFNATGSVTVTTPLASGFKVTRLNPRGAYWVEPCPTFTNGKVILGINEVRRTLIRE